MRPNNSDGQSGWYSVYHYHFNLLSMATAVIFDFRWCQWGSVSSHEIKWWVQGRTSPNVNCQAQPCHLYCNWTSTIVSVTKRLMAKSPLETSSLLIQNLSTNTHTIPKRDPVLPKDQFRCAECTIFGCPPVGTPLFKKRFCSYNVFSACP